MNIPQKDNKTMGIPDPVMVVKFSNGNDVTRFWRSKLCWDVLYANKTGSISTHLNSNGFMNLSHQMMMPVL